MAEVEMDYYSDSRLSGFSGETCGIDNVFGLLGSKNRALEFDGLLDEY